MFTASVYINNSFHLVRKNARKFFRRQYLFPRKGTAFELREWSSRKNCEFQGTDNVQGQISDHFFLSQWRLLCLWLFLLSFPITFPIIFHFYFLYYCSQYEWSEHWGISPRYSPVLAGHIQSRHAFVPIACERKYLIDYKAKYYTWLVVSFACWAQ